MKATKSLYVLTMLLFIFSQYDLFMQEQPTEILVWFLLANLFCVLNSFFCTLIVFMTKRSRKKIRYWDIALSFWMIVHILLILTPCIYYLDYAFLFILGCLLGCIFTLPMDDKIEKKKRSKTKL